MITTDDARHHRNDDEVGIGDIGALDLDENQWIHMYQVDHTEHAGRALIHDHCLTHGHHRQSAVVLGLRGVHLEIDVEGRSVHRLIRGVDTESPGGEAVQTTVIDVGLLPLAIHHVRLLPDVNVHDHLQGHHHHLRTEAAAEKGIHP